MNNPFSKLTEWVSCLHNIMCRPLAMFEVEEKQSIGNWNFFKSYSNFGMDIIFIHFDFQIRVWDNQMKKTSKFLQFLNYLWFTLPNKVRCPFLSTSIYDLVLIYVCHFHHHFLLLLTVIFNFDHYRDTRASILDPCIQGIFLLWNWAILENVGYFPNWGLCSIDLNVNI